MALSSTRKPSLVSARELPKLVSAAVKAASARVQGADTGPSSGALVLKWELVGRRARSLAQGEELAAAITAELGKSGFKAQPAVLGVGKEIICGFFEPPNVPLARDL